MNTEIFTIINKVIHNCNKCEILRSVTPNSMPMWIPSIESIQHNTIRYLFVGLNPGLEGVPDEFSQIAEDQNSFYERYLNTFLSYTKLGNFIKYLIKESGEAESVFAFTNIIKCRKPRDMVFKDEFFKNCKEYLDLQIKLLKPIGIIAFGKRISKYIDFGNKLILTHPSYYLYDTKRVEFQYDLGKFLDFINKNKHKSKLQYQTIVEDENGYLF